MKRTLRSLLLGTALAVVPIISCKEATPLPIFEPSEMSFDIPEIEYTWNGFGGALRWVAENINYVPDKDGEIDCRASPAETYLKREGDPKDFVILDLYLLKRDFGIEGKMITGILNGNEHTWLEVNGDYFDGVTGKKYFQGYTVLNRIDYDKVMELITKPMRR